MRTRFFQYAAAICLALTIWGCASAPQVKPWEDVRVTLDRLAKEGAPNLLSAEYMSAEETLATAERLYSDEMTEEAERYLQLARLKARLLEKNLLNEKARIEEERLLKEEQAEEEKVREEQIEAQAREKEKEKEKDVTRRKPERRREHEKNPSPPEPERLPTYHTVKRGETLPQIAALPDVYNDPSLWPLLYRANRDQIRDPNFIWPGQVLLISRNASKDEVSEARRYAQERPIQ